jgi:hypothetical protein
VTPELIHQSINDSIAFLNAQLTKLQTQINDHIDRYPGLKKDLDLLQSIPAIGPQSGMQLLAVMHTHQFNTAEQLSAYLGLVPIERQSGSSLLGRAKLSKAGPSRIRAVLYMAAIVATKYNPHVKALFERLLAGKSKISALGACMRKTGSPVFRCTENAKKVSRGVSKSLTEKTVSTHSQWQSGSTGTGIKVWSFDQSLCNCAITLTTVPTGQPIVNHEFPKQNSMLNTFLYPYFSLIYSASWNIQQSLEGMGIRSSSFVEYDAAGHIVSSYWSPAQSLLPILGLLSLLAIFLSIAFVVAGYAVHRKVGGVCALLLLCLPGILSVMSIWPEMHLIPDTFVIGGSGILGSAGGVAPLLGMGVLAGWIGVILLSDLLRLGENFSHAYDHVWCLSGVIAAAFFVADSQVGEHARNLQESVKTVQGASTYLSRQVTTYEQWCNANQKQNTASCRWAANIQQKLLNYSTQGATLYRDFGSAVE